MPNFKLVCHIACGKKYPKGAIVTDPAEIEEIMSGDLAKRFRRAPLSADEAAHVEARAKQREASEASDRAEAPAGPSGLE